MTFRQIASEGWKTLPKKSEVLPEVLGLQWVQWSRVP
jgi:hypothetical protein